MMHASGYKQALFAVAASTLCASSAMATVTDYQINPAFSSITMTASCADLTVGGGTTSLGGTLQADVTDTAIKFTGGAATANSSTGASFFYDCTAWLIGVDVMLNNLSLQLSSSPLSLSEGAFNASGAAVKAGGTMDSQGTGLFGWVIGGGSSPLASVAGGSYASGTGHVVSDGTTERVLVPINTVFDAKLPPRVIEPWKTVKVQLTGWIVAEADDDSGRPKPPVPEPATFLLLVGGAAALMIRRR